MRHRIDHRKLNRTSEHRRALLRNQAMSLVHHDRITTTLEKAKEVRRFVEKLITLAKKDTLASRRLAATKVDDPKALKKLFGTLGSIYANRAGGYTRILKLGARRGDGARMAALELVGREPKFDSAAAGKKKASAKKGGTSSAKTAKPSESEAASKEAPAQEGSTPMQAEPSE